MPDTAKEVLERADAQSKLLGQTYGRLQNELLKPLVDRSMSIMQEKGLIPKDDRS